MKIGITGCTGRVGKLLIDELRSGEWQNLELAGGTCRDPHFSSDYFVTRDPSQLFECSDAVIDFTLPEATLSHAQYAARHKKILIVGTTGLSAEQEKKLKDAAHSVPIVYAANMSLGVNLLAALVEQAARALSPSGWDIEVFETHHHNKIDAPSGTALLLGKAAATGRETTLPCPVATDRNGRREPGEIGFSVARGGDVVGEHTVFFFGQGERLELTHRATNRTLFARGALKAAQWAMGKPAGLYTMRDVLGLK